MSDITINHEEFVHAGLHKPTVRAASLVLGGNRKGKGKGKVQGLIVINLNLNGLFDRLKSHLSSVYQLYLSNHWGDYLIHPNSAEAFGFDPGRRILIQDFLEPVGTLINGKSASVVTNVQGVQQAASGLMAAFVRKLFGGSVEKHFVIPGLSQPLANVVREAGRMGWNTVQMILVLGVLAALLAELVSRAVTDPLPKMVEVISLSSKEQVVSALPEARKDEIGLLASSLNDMQNIIVANLRDLKESRQALEHLAQHDSLTSLPNRALFDDRLHQALSQSTAQSNALGPDVR